MATETSLGDVQNVESVGTTSEVRCWVYSLPPMHGRQSFHPSAEHFEADTYPKDGENESINTLET